MTGLEHYREAERLLESARPDPYRPSMPWNHDKLAAARIHAMLATVAMTVGGQWPDQTPEVTR